MNEYAKSAGSSAVRLALFALVFVGILALVWFLVKDRIFDQERKALLASVTSVLPAGYDNDPSTTLLRAADSRLGREPKQIFQAASGNQVIALAIQTATYEGYNGQIDLLVGVNRALEVTGVRILSHQETPGIGDGFERDEAHWTDQFVGMSGQSDWKLQRKGGDVWHLTGATITTNAITKQIQSVLEFVADKQATLFANLPSSESAEQIQ